MNETMTTDVALIPDALRHVLTPPFAREAHNWHWRLARDGAPWACATDGRMMLAVEVGVSSLPDPPEKKAGGLAKILAAPVRAENGTHATDVQLLRAWAGPVPAVQLEPCDCCGGDGLCECDCCGHQHTCRPCKGTGQQERYDVAEAVVLGAVVDRQRLARLLERQQGPCRVTVRDIDSPATAVSCLWVEGDGWLAVLCAMEKPITEDIPRFPEGAP